MSLKTRLEEDLKDAVRAGDTLRRSVIRLVRSEIRNEEIAAQKDLDDDGVLQVLSRQVKQRRDSIDAFAQVGRQDLVDQERAEMAVLLEYLPEQLSRDEIAGLVTQAIEETGAGGPADMGKVMGRVMPQLKGRAQGADVSAVVMELLKAMTG
ncbi:MAG: GatB/YqeY domain-containing protein [Chloroflexi bacterium]|nr:GatB/YqeY domain-containing protein [Chloroflexota bacterium]